MNQDKDFKSRSKKRKKEEGKSPFLKGCQAVFSGLPPHCYGLGTGIELCWLAPPMAGLPNITVFHLSAASGPEINRTDNRVGFCVCSCIFLVLYKVIYQLYIFELIFCQIELFFKSQIKKKNSSRISCNTFVYIHHSIIACSNYMYGLSFITLSISFTSFQINDHNSDYQLRFF